MKLEVQVLWKKMFHFQPRSQIPVHTKQEEEELVFSVGNCITHQGKYKTENKRGRSKEYQLRFFSKKLGQCGIECQIKR